MRGRREQRQWSDIIIVRTAGDGSVVEVLIHTRTGGGVVARLDDERAVWMAEELLACAREVRIGGRRRS